MIMTGRTRPILLFSLVVFGAVISLLNPINGLLFYVVIALTIWIYAKPLFGFYLAFLIAPLENVFFEYDSPLRTLSEKYSVIIFPVALTTLVLLTKKTLKNNPRNSHPFNNIIVLLLLFILGWSIISYLWSIDIYHGINTIYNVGLGIAIYFLTLSFIKDKETFEKTSKILLLWGFILAISLFLSNKVVIDQIHTKLMDNVFFRSGLISYDKRPGGFSHPNRTCSFLSFVFFMGIALYPKVKRNIKILLLLLGLFLISCIISTGSKGGIGAFLLGMLIFIFIHPGVRKKIISFTSLFLFCMVSVAVFNVIVLNADRIVKGGEQAAVSLTSRLEYWKTGFDMLSNRWIGAGVGGFAVLIDPEAGAHSFYFSILFDLGIIGLVMFFLFIAYICVRLRRAIINTEDKDMKLYLYCMVCSLIVFLIHGLVEMSYDMLYFWMLIGTVTAVINISEKEQRIVKEQGM